MMNKFGKFTAVVLLLTVSVFPLQAEIREADVQAVYEMFEAQGMREQMNKIMLVMVQNQLNAVPALKEYQNELILFYVKNISYDVLKKDLARIYLKYFKLSISNIILKIKFTYSIKSYLTNKVF